MSGIIYDGQWLENAELKCRNCCSPIYVTYISQLEYEPRYYCLGCERVVSIDEIEEQDWQYSPTVMIARANKGITINTELEFIQDEGGEPIVFENQVAAERYLLSCGIDPVEAEDFYFIEPLDVYIMPQIGGCADNE